MPLRVNGFLVDYIEHNGAKITSRPQRLRTCNIDINNGTVSYTLEGDSNNYGLTFVIDGDNIIYTWPDGFECSITITGGE